MILTGPDDFLFKNQIFSSNSELSRGGGGGAKALGKVMGHRSEFMRDTFGNVKKN